MVFVMKKPPFINNYFYHIFNRGVDKRNIFLDDRDYHRFLFGLKEFNDVNSTLNLLRRFNLAEGSSTSFKPLPKELLVNVVCYCLMPNHFHFVLKQLKDNGIPSFMRKLGTGYTNYFNQRYKRSGSLFQGRYKAILIDKDEYINYLIQYIHLNPLELLEPDWKEKGIRDFQKAKDFLTSYRWSDCKNFYNQNEFLKELNVDFFDSPKDLVID